MSRSKHIHTGFDILSNHSTLRIKKFFAAWWACSHHGFSQVLSICVNWQCDMFEKHVARLHHSFKLLQQSSRYQFLQSLVWPCVSDSIAGSQCVDVSMAWTLPGTPLRWDVHETSTAGSSTCAGGAVGTQWGQSGMTWKWKAMGLPSALPSNTQFQWHLNQYPN